MTGLIIAVSVIGALFVATLVVGSIKIYRLSKSVSDLANCFLTYLTTQAEGVDIVETYDLKGGSDFTFPNSRGF